MTMTATEIGAHTGSGPAGIRSAADFQFAKRHSQRVGLLRRLLPGTALVLVVTFVTSTFLSFVPDASFSLEGAAIEDGKLVMNAPKMNGFDKHDRPFDVRAARALQDLRTPDRVELEAIEAKLPLDDDKQTAVSARSGLYDTKSERLTLRGDVLIRGARGMDIALDRADIDVKTGRMTSTSAVRITSPDAHMTADSVTVERGGKRVVFKGRVRTTILRPVERGKSLEAGGSID